MGPDINHVLKIYLGADENGGYEPLYCDERLREAFPERYAEMRRCIAPYLEMDHEPEGRLDLMREAGRFEEMLRTRFPELDGIAVRALRNRWHFGWSR